MTIDHHLIMLLLLVARLNLYDAVVYHYSSYKTEWNRKHYPIVKMVKV